MPKRELHPARPGPYRQRGVVLLITLIALVTLALAALALVRSVDTNIIVAGNVSLKQAATLTADNGVETAIEWMNSVAPDTFEVHRTANAYYATSSGFDPLLDETWAAGGVTTRVATGAGITNGVDLSGNRIRYVIQRMCSETGVPTVDICLLIEGAAEGYSQGVSTDRSDLGNDGLASPVYRITARVDGPRNTVSYVQAFVY
ncbi:hypothetical protein [Thauera sp.]|uniref:pilus assembly PilX family protein n=1 Tax=Thauera sp. TaxID=1905334 RepID=UPI0039E6533E